MIDAVARRAPIAATEARVEATPFTASERLLLLGIVMWPLDAFAVDVGLLVTPALAAYLAAAAVVIAQHALGTAPRDEMPWPGVNRLMVVFLIAVTVTSVVGFFKLQNVMSVTLEGGSLRSSDFRWLMMLGKMMFYGFIYYMLVSGGARRRFMRAAFTCILFTAAVNSAYAIYQVFGTYFSLPFVFYARDAVSGEIRNEMASFMGLPRISGLTGEPKALAGFLVTALIVNICAIAGRQLFTNRVSWGYALLALNVSALLMTFARSGWVMFLVAVPITAFLLAARDRRFASVGLVIVVGLNIALAIGVFSMLGADSSLTEIALTRIESVQEIFSDDYRPAYAMRLGVDVAFDNILTGVGFGNFGFYLASAFPAEIDAIYLLHNMYLSVVVETGVIGLVALLLFMGVSCAVAWKEMRQAPAGFSSWSVLTALAIALTFCGTSLYAGGPSIEFFIIFGLLNGAVQESRRSRNDLGPKAAAAPAMRPTWSTPRLPLELATSPARRDVPPRP